jgi:hypothetical protein
MVRIKKRNVALRQTEPNDRPVPPLALSIDEFASSHGISKDTFFKLQRLGLGPQTMKVGARTLISIEAASRWRAQRELSTKQAAHERKAVVAEAATAIDA